MAQKHSRLAPSASKRWMQCPGSVAFVGDAESPTSPQAEEGTVAHAVAEARLRELLKKRKTQKGKLPLWNMVKGKKASDFVDELEHDDFDITAEFCDAVQDYVDFCMDVHKAAGKGAESKVETHVQAMGECEGTVDFNSGEDFGLLHVVDLKFGKGVYVDIKKNSQAMIYLLGASKLGVYESYRISIVQPRWRDETDRIRTLDVSQETLDLFESNLKICIDETEAENAPLVTGDGCLWCPMKGSCPEHVNVIEEATGLSVLDDEGELFIAKSLSGSDLARVLNREKIITTFLKEARVEADNRLAKDAESVPGFQRVRSSGNRKFRDEKAFEKVVSEAFSPEAAELLYETKRRFLSPAQVAGIMPARSDSRKEMKALVTTHTYKPEGGVKVVPLDDKRPAIENASSAFDDDLEL